MEPNRPNIQIDNEVRPMTDEEYEALLASGWTPEGMTEPEPESTTPTE
jgi:hypothetical protein